MAHEIAVVLDSRGRTGSLGEPGRVRVYRRWRKSWTTERELEFALGAAGGLKGLRRQMGELIGFLGECRVFVASSLSGVPYYELEKAGFNIWEQTGEPLHYLEEVWTREEIERTAPKAATALAAAVPAPVETAPGHFCISLREIQAKNCGVTSKQVLQPFLRRRRFAVLEVVCGHLPPWLETELTAGEYHWHSQPAGEREMRVVIQG